MFTKAINGVELLFFSNLAACDFTVGHFVSTRNGGISNGVYSSLNLGLSSGDAYENIVENRRRLAYAVGIAPERFVVAQQVHSANIAVVDDGDCGKGMFSAETAIADTDGLITNRSNVCLIAKSADCVPVLLFDPVNKAVAAVHSGWKGTLKLIVQQAVITMKNYFGTKPALLMAGIGPSNGPCCYEVGDEVIDAVANVFDTNRPFLLYQKQKKKFHLDLWKTNEFILLESGLNRKNIEIASLCTQCNPNLFYSARRHETGRIFAGIYLK